MKTKVEQLHKYCADFQVLFSVLCELISMINCWFAFHFKGRQKLARFTGPEFTTLIIDILNDARRREMSSSGKSTAGLQYIYFI